MRPRRSEPVPARYRRHTGINASVAIADTELSDQQLAALGLHPLGTPLSAEGIVLVPDDQRACVRRMGGRTVIVDGGSTIGAALDEGDPNLPGTIHIACVVDTVAFADYRVLRDGARIRHLVGDQGKITANEGVPLLDESEILVDGEVDGELLFMDLPRLLGIDDIEDPLELEGDVYAGDDHVAQDGADSTDSPTPAAAPADPQPRRGFFSRLFGG